MPLALVAIFVALALLSLSASEGAAGRQRALNTLVGAVAVGAVVLVLARAGLSWAGLIIALLWAATRRRSPSVRSSVLKTRASSGAGPGSAPPSPARARMTREEAYAVLGLTEGASKDQILAEYRRLMKKVHPDLGGTTYLAARLNEAKDLLVGS